MWERARRDPEEEDIAEDRRVGDVEDRLAAVRQEAAPPRLAVHDVRAEVPELAHAQMRLEPAEVVRVQACVQASKDEPDGRDAGPG